MTDLVLDASAVLILLNRETGADLVEQAIGDASRTYLSAVNLAEVGAKLLDAGIPNDEVQMILEGLPVTIVAFGLPEALAAASLRKATRSAGLSLGDRACLALAAALDLPVLTADRAWSQLNLPVEVVLPR